MLRKTSDTSNQLDLSEVFMFVSIGEIADCIGVSTSTIRRWEKEAQMSPSFRTKDGHRRYSIQKVQESLGLLTKSV